MNRFVKNQNAFTLIEVIVALGIFATIISMGVVSYRGYASSARDARRKVDVEEMRSALELYRSDQANASYPLASNLSNLVPTYIREIPVDPITDVEYSYTPLPDSPACTNLAGNLCTSYQITANLEDGTTYTVTP